MTVLAIAPKADSGGKHPRDASGAFQPQARAFVRLHGGTAYVFDNTGDDVSRFRSILTVLEGARGPYDGIGLFMHGTRRGLQCGARPWNVGILAHAIGTLLSPGAPVALYACSAGEDLDPQTNDKASGPGGEGGLASRLAGALAGAHHVDAHVSEGHTTANPYVRRFGAGGIGEWLVDPASDLFHLWRRRLVADQRFRLSFPLHPAETIRTALASGADL